MLEEGWVVWSWARVVADDAKAAGMLHHKSDTSISAAISLDFISVLD